MARVVAEAASSSEIESEMRRCPSRAGPELTARWR